MFNGLECQPGVFRTLLLEGVKQGAKELAALVAACQHGAISRDTLLHNLRAGELLPPARTNEQELVLIAADPPPGPSTLNAQPSTTRGTAAAGADE